MLRRLATLIAIAGLLCLWPQTGPAADTTVTIPAPVADTTLFQSNPDFNLGGGDVVSGTTHQGQKSRGLIRFDLAGQVPANAVITAVQLKGQVIKLPASSPSGSTFALHRLLVDWGEGDKQGNVGSTASNGEATWTARFVPNVSWSAPGAASPADYNATISSSVFVDQFGSYTFPTSANLVADVQAWVASPASNFGWILISQNESTISTARRFGARDSATPFTLTITFHTASEVPAPRISSSRQVGDQFELGFAAETGFDYRVEFVHTLGAAWTTLTNLSVSSPTNLLVRDSLGTPATRFYRVGRQPR